MTVSCPHCGKEMDPKGPICGCSMMFRGEITNVRGWETETVVSMPMPTRSKRLPGRTLIVGAAVPALLIAIVMGLTLPRYLRSPETVVTTSVPGTTTVSSRSDSVRSDLVPGDDLIPPDDSAPTKEEVFTFTPTAADSENAMERRAAAPQPANKHAPETSAGTASPEADTLDSRLLTDNAPSADKRPASPAEPPCKPENPVATRSNDLPAPPPAKMASEGRYTLGPRGGCYIVTSSGGKKYVDRSLCSQLTAASARQ